MGWAWRPAKWICTCSQINVGFGFDYVNLAVFSTFIRLLKTMMILMQQVYLYFSSYWTLKCHLSDIKMLGSILHLKVHNLQHFFFPLSRLIWQRHYNILLKCNPSLIKVSDTSAHQEMATSNRDIWQWPLYKGVGLLHYLTLIVYLFKESSRPVHTGSRDVTVSFLSNSGETVFPHILLLSAQENILMIEGKTEHYWITPLQCSMTQWP